MHWKPSTGNGNPEDRQQGDDGVISEKIRRGIENEKRTINGSVSADGSVMVLFRIGLRAGG